MWGEEAVRRVAGGNQEEKRAPHIHTHTTEGNKINKELGEWERKREKKGYYYRTTAGRT